MRTVQKAFYRKGVVAQKEIKASKKYPKGFKNL